MYQRLKKAILCITALGILTTISALPSMAASKSLGSNYVIDLRAGTLLLQENEQSFAADCTLNAMINNGVIDYNESWKFNEYDLDQDGTKDLMLDELEADGKTIFLFTALAGNSIHGQITVTANAETKDALTTDGNDYFEALTFRYPDSLPVPISGALVSGIADKEYTGKALTQDMTVKLSDLVLLEGTNYSVTYKDNINPGTATVTITGIGTCTGTITKTFQITEKSKTPDESGSGSSSTNGSDTETNTTRAKGTEQTNAGTNNNEAKNTETGKETSKAVKKGKVYTVSGLKYKVTNANTKGKGTVTLTGTTIKKTKLKKLTVPTLVKINGFSFKVTVIGKNAFKKYSYLKTLTVGNNVKTIETGAFLGDTALTKVTIGTGLAKIAGNVFDGDKKLSEIMITSKKLTSVGKNAIRNIKAKAKIKVPKAKLKQYKKLFTAKTGYKKTMTVTKLYKFKEPV